MKKFISLVLTPALLIGGLAGTSVIVDAPAAQAASSVNEVNTAIQTILKDTNDYRALFGMAPLVNNSSINTVAQNWSVQQSINEAMSHNDNFTSEIPAGAISTAENVGTNGTPSTIVKAWINSSGHRQNLLGNYTDIGIGYYYGDDGVTYFTQDFAYYTSTKLVPGQQSVPTVTTVVDGIKAQFVPDRDGNSPITSYDIRAIPVNGGNTANFTTTSSPYVLKGLAAGESYSISTRAINSVGAGAWSTAAIASAPATAPSAPSNLDIIPDLTSVGLTWDAKANGSAITSYSVTLDGKATIATTTGSASFTGLNPGVHYTGSITATNAIGTSPATNFAFDTPITIPDAPSSVTNTLLGADSVKIVWADGASNGGSSINGYDVTLYKIIGSAESSVVETIKSTSMTHSFSKLSKGTAYYVTVGANNGAGQSALSRTDFTVPATVASAPRSTKAVLADEQEIAVTWTAPTDNGGSALTGYKVDFYANGSSTSSVSLTTAAEATQVTATQNSGIKSDTTYKVKVTAINSVGSSAASTASSDVVVPKTPTAPDAATGVTVKAVTVSGFSANWTAPAYNGGSAITGYKVVLKDSEGAVVSSSTTNSTTTTKAFTGLSRGTSYSVSVTAVNDRGDSPVVSVNAETAIEAPTKVLNTVLSLEGYSSLDVSWDAPNDNGGSAITDYRVELFANGAFVSSHNSKTTNIALTKLPFATEYTVVVYAANKSFESQAGTTSNAVSTPTAPTAPINPAISADGSRSVDVTWEAPTSVGTYTLEYFEVILRKADGTLIETKKVDSDVLKTSFNSLTPGVSYFATVTSHSKIAGGFSTTTEATTEFELATAPAVVKVSLDGSTALKVTWAAPESDGGSPVTGYNVIITNEKNEVVDSVLNAPRADIVFSNLNPVTTYTVTVTAITIAGESASAKDSITTKAISPSSPAKAEAALGSDSKSVVVTWEAPASNGGSALNGYNLTLKSSLGETVEKVTVASDVATHTFSKVAYGMTYHVEVSALNEIGTSPATSSQSVLIPAIVSEAPTNVKTTLDGALTIVATWNSPVYDGGSKVVEYNASIRDNEGNVVESKTVNTRTVSFSNLNPVTEYIVDVTAVNAVGTSTNASSAKLATKAIAPSEALNAALTVDGTNINATWEASLSNGGDADITYSVSLKNSKDEVVAKTETKSLNTVFISLPRGEDYTLTVEASNSAGKALKTVSNSVTVEAVVPTSPEAVKAEITGNQEVTLSWAAPAYNGGSAITGYKVIVIKGDMEDVTDVPLGETSFVVKDLAANSVYRFAVIAVNNVGDSEALFAEGEFLTSPADAPEAPTNEQVSDFAKSEITQDGNNLKVTLSNVAEGTWVYGYAYSTPTELGWTLVEAGGVVNFSIANAKLPSGTHTLVVLDTEGNMLVSGSFTVAELVGNPTPAEPNEPALPTNPLTPVVPASNTDVKATDKTAATDKGIKTLASTGVEGLPTGVLIGSGALSLGVLIMSLGAFLRRRKVVEN